VKLPAEITHRRGYVAAAGLFTRTLESAHRAWPADFSFAETLRSAVGKSGVGESNDHDPDPSFDSGRGGLGAAVLLLGFINMARGGNPWRSQYLI
jgi:hypothetical protein